MPYCPNCGAPLPDGAKFCGSCGSPASAASSNASGAPTYSSASNEPAYSQTYTNPQPTQSAYTAPTRPIFSSASVEPYNTTGLWIWSIVTILLSLIPGVVAISLTRQVNKCATAEEQRKKIKAAKIWCIVGNVIGVLAIIAQAAQG